jgi:hypothetical protein
VVDYMGDYDQAVADNNSFLVSWGDNRLPNPAIPNQHPNQPDVRFASFPQNFVPPAQTVPPPPLVTTLPVFTCNLACPTLTACDGRGQLITHAQFCSFFGPAPQPAPVAPAIASATGLTAAGQPVFRCNLFCSHPGACYSVGVLTTFPQSCSISGQAAPPLPVSAAVATDTGLTITGGDHVFRCNFLTFQLGRREGIGMLTTHPQFCDPNGPAPAPAAVSPALATDSGLRAR